MAISTFVQVFLKSTDLRSDATLPPRIFFLFQKAGAQKEQCRGKGKQLRPLHSRGNVPRWPPVKQRPVISSTSNEGYRFLGRTFDHPEYWSAPSLCMSLCGAHARKNCDQHGAANLYHWAALCEVSKGLRHRGIRQVGFSTYS
ncbi:hypothetical protein CDAR_245431 [Caerostris darwini]|uniref:Uncharacterized protein n=1 Tax=Caerostris darwini TaxID=1538125 RepID=A0AAV4NXQ4_9ARAC|nr:hypothetical protein CDAR_245111 [Caerostris darwini]GIX89794.1 hypothetical protein CDAR_245431 [Caerostris darwini]